MSVTTVLERAPKQRVQMKSASALAFAPNGVLLVGRRPRRPPSTPTRPATSAPAGAGADQIEDLTGKIAALLGTTSDQIRVPDIAVNPASGNVYIAVKRRRGRRRRPPDPESRALAERMTETRP